MVFRSLLVLALLLSGCDGDGGSGDGGGGADSSTVPSGPHVVTGWRMRCASGTCPPEDAPERYLDHSHGQDGADVRCDLQFDGTTRRMDLTARSGMGSGYGFEVRGAMIGEDGGRLMGSFCQIRFFEPDDVDTLTMCTASSPSDGMACQINQIDIRDVDGVPTLLGQIRCDDVPAEGSPGQIRNITSPTATSGAAEFAFTGCAGL